MNKTLEETLASGKTQRPGNYAWEILRKQVLERDGFRCVIDHRTELLEVDHIVPVALGGSASTLENLQTLCSECHKRKTKNDAERARRVNTAKRMERRRASGAGAFA